jgi:hypothetical protein
MFSRGRRFSFHIWLAVRIAILAYRKLRATNLQSGDTFTFSYTAELKEGAY